MIGADFCTEKPAITLVRAGLVEGVGWLLEAAATLVLAFELGEENDVADGGGSGEEHDEAVDADTDAACGGHAVFEGFDEVFVDFLGFAARLFVEAAALDVRVVELGVAWGDFLSVDDEFVNVDHGRVFKVLFCKRDELGIDVGDEAGVEGVFLDEFLEDLLGHFVVFEVVVDFEFEFALRFGAAVVGGEVKPVVAGSLFDERLVRGALPWTTQIEGADGVAVFVFVLDLEGAEEFLSEVADHLFDEVGHDFEVAEGLVGFEHGELGVVAAGDALVTEVAVEFEDFGEAAD